MTRKEILPIGVDIGGSAIKLVQLSHVYDQAELLACARITIPENLRTDQRQRLDCLKKDIPQALKANSFKGKKCILSLPAANTFIRAVKIPRLNPKATEAAVRHAAQMELPCPISEAVVRHIVAGEVYDNGKMLQEVIMIAMPLDVLNAYLDVFRRMGLEVVGVGVAPVALVKCFTKLLSNSILRAAFVDLGFASTQVTISHGANPDPGFSKDAAPTAMARAVAAVQPGYGNAAPLQLDLDFSAGANEEDRSKIAALIKAHFDLGGTQININILDKEKLLEAEKDPQKSPALVVRVTGFSAYFAMLSNEFRRWVIERIVDH